jgi:hypothetical protein
MRNQADEMLTECRVVDILSKHGDVRVFGSYELDLMVWPEIDVYVINPQFHPPMAWDIVKDLSQVVPPTVVFVANQIDHALGLTPVKSVAVDYRLSFQTSRHALKAGPRTRDRQGTAPGVRRSRYG